MAQSAIDNYFNTRKRSALEDTKINRAKKVLILDTDASKTSLQNISDMCIKSNGTVNNNVKCEINKETAMVDVLPTTLKVMAKKKSTTPRPKKLKINSKHTTIDHLFSSVGKTTVADITSAEEATPIKIIKMKKQPTIKSIDSIDTNSFKTIPEPTPERTLSELKKKITCSSRLTELKASIARFKQAEQELKIAEKNTKQSRDLLTLKNFKTIELDINLSPQKPQSPEKAYLSPKKDNSTVRKNLFNVQSPTKNAVQMPSKKVELPVKESLTLPYKYRCLAEMFRSIDTVCQILYNRKETITLKKLKPAVEEIMKRNLTEKHLAQIKFLYPESFILKQQKMREFGTGNRKEQWELVLLPLVDQQTMTPEFLLERRRKFYSILIEKLKTYHQEFLVSLDPPMLISRENITRWHPQFDIEKVPDVELASLPQPPNEEKLTTGSQVLEKARSLFNCNTRMERALERLKESQSTPTNTVETPMQDSILKGIPKAILEKVRQKQAAKALELITRSPTKEKEVQLYSRLPEIARLARNLFVSEKKNVMPLELVVDKLCNSSRLFLSKNQMEEYLKTIAKVESEWLKFEEIRGLIFVKISKHHDLSLIMNNLQNLADQKMT